MAEKTQIQELEELLEEDMLIDPEVVDTYDAEDITEYVEYARTLEEKPLLVDKAVLDEFLEKWSKSKEEKGVKTFARSKHRRETSVKIEHTFKETKVKRDVPDFVRYFNNRLEKMTRLLTQRMEMQGCTSIHSVKSRQEREEVTFIGIINEKRVVKNNRVIVTISDTTDTIKALLSEEDGMVILPDDVVGVKGVMGRGIVFVNKIVYPDLPVSNTVNRTSEDIYAAFISDTQFGSRDTNYRAIDRLVQWLKTSAFAEKIHYLFISGDIADGIGIYGGQHKQLLHPDIYKQYDLFQAFLEQVPEDIQVLVSPGNHDIVRLAEPQPRLPKDCVSRVHDLKNIHFLPNPATVTVHGMDANPGIRTLMYHGYSFDRHVDALPHLRKDAYRKPIRTMIDLLKRRHLAPMYGSAPISPEEEDHLVIDTVPDIFVIGHIHSFALANYKGTNLICASTFQKQTPFQRRLGHIPDPNKISLINLKTRQAGFKVF